jgi:hypothetical protein
MDPMAAAFVGWVILIYFLSRWAKLARPPAQVLAKYRRWRSLSNENGTVGLGI